MAAPKKVGTKWQHRVMVAGVRTSGTFDTKAAALAWEAEQRVATPKGKLGLTKTCADAFEKYELEVSKQKRGYRWEALSVKGNPIFPSGSVFGANQQSSFSKVGQREA